MTVRFLLTVTWFCVAAVTSLVSSAVSDHGKRLLFNATAFEVPDDAQSHEFIDTVASDSNEFEHDTKNAVVPDHSINPETFQRSSWHPPPVHAIAKLDPSILTTGNAIVIRGSPADPQSGHHLGAKFDISLSTGPNMVGLLPDYMTDNVALEVSYRSWSLGSRRVILNSFENRQWKNEQECYAPMIQQDIPFEMRIVMDQSWFGIFVNGQKIGDFNFRLPLNQVRNVYILGDISLQSIDTVVNGTMHPLHNEATAGSSPNPGIFSMPHLHTFFRRLQPGHKLVIVGTPDADAVKFQINLYAGQMDAFQTEVNFQEKTVYRDSRTKGEELDKKMETETKTGFPFSPGKQFHLLYIIGEDAFQVYVDGVHQFAFKYRLPLYQITAVGIKGNLKLHNVKLSSG